MIDLIQLAGLFLIKVKLDILEIDFLKKYQIILKMMILK